MGWPSLIFLLAPLAACQEEYGFANPLKPIGDSAEKAVEAPGQGVTASGVHSLVVFTVFDDYPYACKCVSRTPDSLVGYCKNDYNTNCYMPNAGLGSRASLLTFLGLAVAVAGS